MNETDMVGVVDKMQAYVVLAEKEIAKRKMQCQLLEDELNTCIAAIISICTEQITGYRGKSYSATSGETSIAIQDAEDRVRRENSSASGNR